MNEPGPSPSPWRFGLRRLVRQRLQFGLALFWSTIFVLVPMQVPVITGALIDSLRSKHVRLYGFELAPDSRRRSVEIAALALMGVALARGASAYLRQLSVNKLTRRFVLGIRHSLLKRLATMPVEYHLRFGSGQLFQGLMADTTNLRAFAGQLVIRNATNALRIVCAVVLMFLHEALLTVICCSVIPVQWALTTFLHRRARQARREARRTRAKFATVVKEHLDGTETIQCLGASEAAIRRARRKANRLEREELVQAHCEARKSGVIWAMTTLAFALAWGLGGLRVLDGEMSTGELVAFVGLLVFAFTPFRRYAVSMGNSRKILTSLAHVQELLSLPRGPVERPDARPLVVEEGRIELRNVTFAYTTEVVLQNLRLILEPHSLTAIAGCSGCGKSSLLRLLNRLYDPQAGQVLIDGTDVREFTVASLRSAVVLVPQRPMIFSGSIASNLRLAKPDATDDELLAACEAADLLRLVRRLKDGLQTRLGKRGVQLSGGEAQRIAIARAVLMRSKILLLDEPTSSLDLQSQATIMDTLCRLKAQMTIVVAGHRLEALGQADRLVVLDQGAIVMQGPPAELLASPRLYRTRTEAPADVRSGKETITLNLVEDV
jgi:ABC-type multidrug transport system fused ATPase/permease subunit